MASIAIQAIPLTAAGLAPAYAAAVGPDTFVNDGKTFLHLKNTNGAARNVTISSPTSCNQGSTHDIVVNVPATTGDKMVGPFPVDRFTAAPAVAYDAVTGLVVAAIRAY